jgi:lysophospholipase L1-like esterase
MTVTLTIEGDCTDCVDPGPTEPTTVLVDQVIGQLGACAVDAYRVDLMARGGRVRVGALTDLVSVQYGRRLDAVSDATVVVAKLGDDCCRELNEADPYATELRIWRNGDVVWEGPVIRAVETASTVTIDARDVMHWTEVRTARETIDDSVDPGRDATAIARDLLVAAFRYDDPDVIEHAWIVPGASKVTRKTDAAQRPYVYAELSDLANTVIDWTVVGRRIVICPTDAALGSAGRINDIDIIGDWSIVKSGQAYTSRQIVTGEGALAAISGGVSTRYGLVERVNNESRLKTQSALNAAAADRYRVTPRPPVWVSLVEDQVQLRPETASTIDELVPGALFEGLFARGCTTLRQQFRLQRVDVSVATTGEKVTIGAVATGYADPLIDSAYEDIVVIGDSITALNSAWQAAPLDRWIDVLERSGFAGRIWYGAAPGATTTSLRVAPMTDPRASDALVVFLGANDMNSSVPSIQAGPPPIAEITPEQYRDGILWFVENYPAQRRIVVFPWRWRQLVDDPENPFYLPVGVPVAEGVYQAYREAAREAAEIAGASFIDLSVAVPESTSVFLSDWIHANANGHQLIANLVMASL